MTYTTSTVRSLRGSERIPTSRVYAGRSWIDPIAASFADKTAPRMSDGQHHAVTVLEPKREGSVITLATGRTIVRPTPPEGDVT